MQFNKYFTMVLRIWKLDTSTKCERGEIWRSSFTSKIRFTRSCLQQTEERTYNSDWRLCWRGKRVPWRPWSVCSRAVTCWWDWCRMKRRRTGDCHRCARGISLPSRGAADETTHLSAIDSRSGGVYLWSGESIRIDMSQKTKITQLSMLPYCSFCRLCTCTLAKCIPTVETWSGRGVFMVRRGSSECVETKLSARDNEREKIQDIWLKTVAVFQNSSSALKIYSLRYVHYRFSALTVNFGTQPMTRLLMCVLGAHARVRAHAW